MPATSNGAGAQTSASKSATPQPSPTGSNTAGWTQAPAPAKGHSGNSSLEATSTLEPAGLSPLVGWGIGLVALSLGAGAAVLRMRRS
ncbi:hypothetical protein [Arthrobacter humicola]|uniref:hypothetical protein n=1 Tax=Arthrobacter humicola TaxID=409291 RepID=UPI001FADC9DC|nr:hypothetical protein [Arthrobacter humicola]MCI9871647.1 hypothetical protein [Arthrobacter humicola]